MQGKQEQVEGLEVELQRDLAARLAVGDSAVFEELLKEHQAAVFRYASSLCHSESDAEDVLQQTFVAAFTSGASYRGDAPVRNWLFRIARNEAFRLHRNVSRSEAYKKEELLQLGQDAGWGKDNPETLVALALEGQGLARALKQLPIELREIIVLRDLEECSGDETAAMLEISMGAMKSRLHRARLKLAQELRRKEEGHG